MAVSRARLDDAAAAGGVPRTVPIGSMSGASSADGIQIQNGVVIKIKITDDPFISSHFTGRANFAPRVPEAEYVRRPCRREISKYLCPVGNFSSQKARKSPRQSVKLPPPPQFGKCVRACECV